MRHRVLVTDDIDPEGVELLRSAPELEVEELPTTPEDVLLGRVAEYEAIVGRSATRISERLLRAATRLRVVGRAGVGVDNVAVDTATELGVAVINAPAGNTVAVAELLFGVLLSLLRHLPDADRSMHEGRWDRARLLGHELCGRRLGIVGLGRIGSEVAVRAAAFNMELAAFDPYVSEERFRTLRVQRAPTLEALLAESDVLTLHTPLTEETRGMISRREIARLPAGAIVANLARGGIVDEAALAAALTSGHLAGVALDVYEREPLAGDSPLRSLPRTILTPHIGASTAEAQRNVAVDVCRAVRDALLNDDLSRSINIAAIQSGQWSELQPAMQLVQDAATTGRALLANQGIRAVRRLSLSCGPEIVGGAGALLSAAAVGVLQGVVEAERLNMISARALARARGIELAVAEWTQAPHPRAIELTLGGGMQELSVAGVAAPGTPARITRIGEFHVDVMPRRTLLILTNHDVPGVIGRVGTLLGDAGVNIAEYHQARLAQGGEALAAISVDSPVGEEIRQRLLEVPEVISATVVQLPAARNGSAARGRR